MLKVMSDEYPVVTLLSHAFAFFVPLRFNLFLITFNFPLLTFNLRYPQSPPHRF